MSHKTLTKFVEKDGLEVISSLFEQNFIILGGFVFHVFVIQYICRYQHQLKYLSKEAQNVVCKTHTQIGGSHVWFLVQNEHIFEVFVWYYVPQSNKVENSGK